MYKYNILYICMCSCISNNKSVILSLREVSRDPLNFQNVMKTFAKQRREI